VSDHPTRSLCSSRAALTTDDHVSLSSAFGHDYDGTSLFILLSWEGAAAATSDWTREDDARICKSAFRANPLPTTRSSHISMRTTPNSRKHQLASHGAQTLKMARVRRVDLFFL
jgi:hypothetical protein